MKLSLIAAGCLLSCSAMATTYTYTTPLSGAFNDPITLTPATGSATVILDDVAKTLQVSVSYSGLLTGATNGHIHCCTAVSAIAAGVAVPFPGMVLGGTSGSYMNTYDLTQTSSYGSGFLSANGGTVAGAFAALVAGLNSTQAYVNIHTSGFPGGEIRGFLAPVPEPATYALMGLGLLGLAALKRRKAA